MKTYKKTTLLALAVAAVLAFAPSAFAFSYGKNITVYDGETGTDVIGASGQGSEDHEAETGMVQSQGWDLEGMFLKGNVLTMIGGFDFFSTNPNSTNYTSGDIFINTKNGFGGGNVTTPQGNSFVTNSFGYEYALDINWILKTFSIVDLTSSSTRTETVYYSQNTNSIPGSNPWRYKDNGTVKGNPGTVINGGKISDADSGFSDWNSNSNDTNHYVASFDLTDFFSVANLYGKDFDVHFTMGCGNDNLMAHDTAPVPEPGTMMLLGFGMLGLAVYGKRRMNKEA